MQGGHVAFLCSFLKVLLPSTFVKGERGAKEESLPWVLVGYVSRRYSRK